MKYYIFWNCSLKQFDIVHGSDMLRAQDRLKNFYSFLSSFKYLFLRYTFDSRDLPENYFVIPERIWLGIFYLAFLSTIIAYLTYIEGVSRLGAGRAAIFINFVPVVGISLSAIFLHEIIDPVVHLLSFLLITLGVTLVNKKVKPNPKPLLENLETTEPISD